MEAPPSHPWCASTSPSPPVNTVMAHSPMLPMAEKKTRLPNTLYHPCPWEWLSPVAHHATLYMETCLTLQYFYLPFLSSQAQRMAQKDRNPSTKSQSTWLGHGTSLDSTKGCSISPCTKGLESIACAHLHSRQILMSCRLRDSHRCEAQDWQR